MIALDLFFENIRYLNRCNLPTLRTDLDIGAEKSETITVSGFFMQIFIVEFHRYPNPKTAFGEDLN